MCGIAGIFYKYGVEGQKLAADAQYFSSKMKHRGPDDEGFVLFTPEGIAHQFVGDHSHPGLGFPHISEALGLFTGVLIHRRLSIITPGITGHQPMHSKDGRYWIVYNGETFNYRELDQKYHFENHSGNDAETALNLVCSREQNGFTELSGFHAFAAYDSRGRQLELYRDPTGVKPLFYAENESCFSFCSQADVLAKYFHFNSLDTSAVFHLLAEKMIIPGKNLISGIQEVNHRLNFDESRFESQSVKYHFVAHKPGESLRSTLKKSIESRLMSDVPLGFAVSGGLDSAIVIGQARKILGPDAVLKLFSVTSSGEEDESHWQKIVADFNGGDWAQTQIEKTGAGLLDEVIRHTGLVPVAWNNLAQFRLAALASENHVKVLFNGQGADEIFGGYPDYLQRQWLKSPYKLWKIRGQLPISYKDILSGWMKDFYKGNAPSFLLKKQFYKRQLPWISEQLTVEGSYNWSLANMDADQKMYEDYFGQKLRQMLLWEDANGMAHSIESRNPFADDLRLAHWLSVPFSKKISNGFTKGILRDAAEDVVPKEVLWRKDKKGFTVPDAKLTWAAKEGWCDAFMSERLNEYSPLEVRETVYKQLHPQDAHSLGWYFRLSALSMFTEHLIHE